MQNTVDEVFEVIGKDMMDAAGFEVVEALIAKGMLRAGPTYPACDDSDQAPL